MTLDEMDRLAAEKVMGWKTGFRRAYKHRAVKIPTYSNPKGVGVDVCVWQPTRNIAQAWECLEKFEGSNNSITYKTELNKWFCLLIEKYILGVAEEDTAPLAIVKACLKAKGVLE